MSKAPQRKPSAADMLRRHLAATTTPQLTETKVEGSLEQGVARRLDEIGVAELAKPEPQWYDRAIEIGQAQEDLEAEWKRRKDADEAAKQREQTAAAMITAAIAKAASGSGSAHIALNSSEILKRALGGGPGTINNGSGE